MLRVLYRSASLRTAAVMALGGVGSCGEGRRPRILSVVCWGSIGVSVAGAYLSGAWDLAWVVYGIATGWLTRCLLTVCLALPYLRPQLESASAPPGRARLHPSSR